MSAVKVSIAQINALVGDLSGNAQRVLEAARIAHAAGAQVRQGMLEGSNVNPLVEITQLIEISRAYERATKMIDNVTELSRRSVERLGRSS